MVMGSVGPIGNDGFGGSGRLWPDVVNLEGRSREGLNGRKFDGTGRLSAMAEVDGKKTAYQLRSE